MSRQNTDHAGRAPVTVIGLGLMGQALAGAFLNGGHPHERWGTCSRAGCW